MKDSMISLSLLDEGRFGIRTAKATITTIDDIPVFLRFCVESKVEFLIARCQTSALNIVHEMERKDFLLMDTQVYYSCDLKKNPPPDYVSELEIRPFRPGEEDIIKSIAAESFKGYLGHYHADSRLDRRKCDETYIDWSFRSCHSKEVADEVFVADYKGQVIGYGTVRADTIDIGHYIIAGILPQFQGMGAYRLILINCMRWCIERKIGKIITSTQITNTAVQKVWIRLGFQQDHSQYTFHKWLE